MKFCLGLATALLILSPACSKKKFAAGSNPVGTAFKQVNEKNINFGDSDVFRIGDGTAGVQSSCASELKGYDLKGTTYYFQFEVIEDDTGIDLGIGKICGVDKDAFTTVSVLNTNGNTAAQAEIAVPNDKDPARAGWVPYQQFKLQKGIYSIVVKSKNVTGRATPSGPGADEYDDFIIGNIEIKGQKKVKAIKVYAE